MLKGGAEFQRQKVLNRAAGNWNKKFLRPTDKRVARIRQVACTGVKCDLWTASVGGENVCFSFKRPKTGKPQQPQHGPPNSYSRWEKAGSS
jgi:hypothetical protein